MKKKQRISSYQLAMIGVMTAITCIFGPLSIALPISPVPVSLTNLAIYIAAFVLGWKNGTVSCLMYILVGTAGLPVFSGFTSGPAKLAGPTGGYLAGFILLALISGWFIERFPGKTLMYVLGMVLGTAVTYFLGTVWLSWMQGYGFFEALGIGVLPFLPGDAVKIVLATVAGPALRKQLRRAGVL